jgi:TetR/AcrR family transcriptional regulator, regulator of cefoperazone and chloramphenicol sensitivity
VRSARASGYAKGKETRLRIVLAAISLFGQEGYQGASTRELALMAGVNLPALQYYFTGKMGLYLACAEHISITVQARLYPVLDRVRATTQGKGARLAELIDGFCTLQDALVDFMIGPAGTGKWAMFMVRERVGLDSNDAFRIMRRQMGTPYTDYCATLLGRIIGRAPHAPETLIRLNTISGQVLPFQRPESSVADGLGWSNAAKGRQTMVRKIIREQTEAILRASATKTFR